VARREISRVNGFVHDVNTVASLSSEPSNIRVLSDRTLYILQNLSLEDVTFLSRYGEILTNGFYIPVAAGSPEQVDVEDAVDLIRRDLNDMSVEQLLECICAAQNAMIDQEEAGGQEIEAQLSDGQVPVGPDEQFPDQASYFDAKCNVSNGIFDTILGAVTWLDDNSVALLIGLFGGVTSGLIAGLIGAGPFGWAVIVTSSVIAGIAAFISRNLVNFSDLKAALIDTQDEAVLSLFNATDTLTARGNFISAVEAGTPAITSIESGVLSLMLTSDMLNNLFTPRADAVEYQSPSPVDCGGALLQVWSFEASGQGWSFRDDSTGTYSASGVWDSPKEAWEVTIVGLGTGTGPRASGTVLITGLSLAIPAGGSIQADYSAPGDGVLTSQKVKAIFSDMTDQTEQPSGTTTAGTLVMTVPAAKTITDIEVTFGRNWVNAFNTTRDLEEVRVIGT